MAKQIKSLDKKYAISINEFEQREYDKFRHEHYVKCLYGAGYPITITPTGIGLHVEVQCPTCKDKRDISDYNSW